MMVSGQNGVREKYRVRLIRLKDRDADRILEQAAGKTGQEITREEVLRLLFTPLMGGKTTQKERIQKGIRMLKETEDIFSRTEISKMEAILYVFAAKFLDRAESLLRHIRSQIRRGIEPLRIFRG